MKNVLRIVLASVVFTNMALISCGQNKIDSKPSGYISAADDRWRSPIIPVCFLQNGYDLDKKLIEKAVTAEFKRANIHFVNWGRCPSNTVSQMVKVEFTDENGSSVSKIGRDVGMDKGVVRLGLNHLCEVTFRGSHCQANTAVHEFGHVVGLHHEMNRRDNRGCHKNQVEGLGESGAIQFGDFDRYSIMNYCTLDRARAKNIYLGLSDGDISTIKALYEKPIARPIVHSGRVIHLKEFKVSIPATDDVKAYKWKAGLRENIDCSTQTGYSAALSVPATLDSQTFTHVELGKTARLCLLGGVPGGLWQPLVQYTSIDTDFLDPKDRSAPILEKTSWQGESQDEDDLVLDLTIHDRSLIHYISLGARYQDYPDRNLISGGRPLQIRPNVWQVKLSAESFNINGKVLIDHIKLEDINHNQTTYQMNNQSPNFTGTSIPVPTFTISGKYDFEKDGPTIEDVRLTKSSPNEISLRLTAHDATGLSTGSITLQHASSGRKSWMSLSFKKESESHWLAMGTSVSPLVNGKWIIEILDLADPLGNHGRLVLIENQENYLNSQIKSLWTVIKGSADFESDPPILLELTDFPKKISYEETLKFKFRTIDQSALNYAVVVLRSEHHDSVLYSSSEYRHLGNDLYESSFHIWNGIPPGEYYAVRVVLQDQFNNRAEYHSKAGQQTFEGTDILVPKVMISSKFE